MFNNGGNLGNHLYENIKAKGKGFNEKRAKWFIAQVVLALEHMHSKGVVHRDLKLDNIMLGPDGYITLIDFG